MKATIEIGISVNGSSGIGTITKIITKSTGYVEVSYKNGKTKKEMAFNLTSLEGEILKNKPVVKEQTESQKNWRIHNFNKSLKESLEQETGRTGLSFNQLKSL
jgi:hypothetical protein